MPEPSAAASPKAGIEANDASIPSYALDQAKQLPALTETDPNRKHHPSRLSPGVASIEIKARYRHCREPTCDQQQRSYKLPPRQHQSSPLPIKQPGRPYLTAKNTSVTFPSLEESSPRHARVSIGRLGLLHHTDLRREVLFTL